MPRGEFVPREKTPEEAAMYRLMQLQYGSAVIAPIRWAVDALADEYVDQHQRALGSLGLAGSETVLDVGCGDGEQLIKLGLEGHEGRLIGVDINPRLPGGTEEETAFALGSLLAKREGIDIEFVQSDARQLEIEDNEVDTAMALFMLYHLGSEEGVRQGLSELQRVVKPGGRIIIATSGEECKFRTHELERVIVEHIGAESGKPFTRAFTAEKARQQLGDYFQWEELRHTSLIHLRHPEWSPNDSTRFTTYKAGLGTYRTSHTKDYGTGPEPVHGGEWEQTFDEVVMKEEIEPEMKDKGSLVDLIDRSVFICRNDK